MTTTQPDDEHNQDTHIQEPGAASQPLEDAKREELTFAGLMARAAAFSREVGPVVTAFFLVSAIGPLVGSIILFWKIGAVREWVHAMGTLNGALVVAGLFALTTGFAVMPTYALSAFCGFALGLATGSWAAMLGVTGGALVGYVLGKLFAQGAVMDVIERNERARVVRAAITDRSVLSELGVVSLLRLPPNSPFALTNFVLSSTRVRLVPYIVGTPAGMAARTLIAVWIGAGMAAATEAFSKAALGEARPGWVLPTGIAVSVVVIVVLYRVLGGWAKSALVAAGLLPAGSGSVGKATERNVTG